MRKLKIPCETCICLPTCIGKMKKNEKDYITAFYILVGTTECKILGKYLKTNGRINSSKALKCYEQLLKQPYTRNLVKHE